MQCQVGRMLTAAAPVGYEYQDPILRLIPIPAGQLVLQLQLVWPPPQMQGAMVLGNCTHTTSHEASGP